MDGYLLSQAVSPVQLCLLAATHYGRHSVQIACASVVQSCKIYVSEPFNQILPEFKFTSNKIYCELLTGIGGIAERNSFMNY